MIRAVINLVVLAISSGLLSEEPQRIAPVLPSAMAQAAAVVKGGPSSGSAGFLTTGWELTTAGAGTGGSTAGAGPRAFRVAGSARPVGSRRLARWNRRTAERVASPKSPSTSSSGEGA